jgi:hypothetical protein
MIVCTVHNYHTVASAHLFSARRHNTSTGNRQCFEIGLDDCKEEQLSISSKSTVATTLTNCVSVVDGLKLK